MMLDNAVVKLAGDSDCSRTEPAPHFVKLDLIENPLPVPLPAVLSCSDSTSFRTRCLLCATDGVLQETRCIVKTSETSEYALTSGEKDTCSVGFAVSHL